jgi:hypothetical protein
MIARLHISGTFGHALHHLPHGRQDTPATYHADVQVGASQKQVGKPSETFGDLGLIIDDNVAYCRIVKAVDCLPSPMPRKEAQPRGRAQCTRMRADRKG